MYFLNINKPKGLSSFDVIRNLRKRLKVKQIGHSGTLDPLASGVLQIAVGNATKLLDFLSSDKTYVASLKFGYNSTTFDDEGEKEFIKEPDFSKNELIEVLNGFIGKSLQIPPKYSAIKINGKKLCDLARNNAEMPEIKPREIEIYDIKLLEFDLPNIKIEVHCKKGTYIRSLAYDIGQKLACGAYLTDLIRTKAGNFDINNSNSLDDVEFNEINPLEAISLETKELNDFEISKIINGNFISKDKNYKNDYILLTKNNKLVSLAKIVDNDIRPKKLFKDNIWWELFLKLF